MKQVALIFAFLASLAFVIGVSISWGDEASDARQKLFDSLKGPKKPSDPKQEGAKSSPGDAIDPEQDVQAGQGGDRPLGTQIRCPRIDTGWRPTQLPMVIPGWAEITFDSGVYLAGVSCRSCHAKVGVDPDACPNWTVARDGRWAFPAGAEHRRHEKTTCRACHIIK